jgi:hypothetical protein
MSRVVPDPEERELASMTEEERLEDEPSHARNGLFRVLRRCGRCRYS